MAREQFSDKGWWYARFRLKWPENTDPLWHIDLLLAHTIIAPVLTKHSHKIPLWRFHRRAARDREGHQFSVTFYSTPETAAHIFRTLQADPVLKQMRKSGVVTGVLCDDTARITTPNIEDTSDGNWKPPIRKSWPLFIMGVCQMWLALIDTVGETQSVHRTSASLRSKLNYYKKIDEAIKILWRDQGCHALLHHLNAIFGYEPVIVRELNLRRF
jgi:hypothetical protein